MAGVLKRRRSYVAPSDDREATVDVDDKDDDSFRVDVSSVLLLIFNDSNSKVKPLSTGGSRAR